MEKLNTKSLILNIIIPIFIGGVIYYLISPDVIFVQYIDNLSGLNLHINDIDYSNFLIRIIRNYLLDMLWGYSLIFALFFVFDKNTADLMKSFVIAFSFSVIMEVVQLIPSVMGIFDVYDILVMFLAEVTAVIVIKFQLHYK